MCASPSFFTSESRIVHSSTCILEEALVFLLQRVRIPSLVAKDRWDLDLYVFVNPDLVGMILPKLQEGPYGKTVQCIERTHPMYTTILKELFYFHHLKDLEETAFSPDMSHLFQRVAIEGPLLRYHVEASTLADMEDMEHVLDDSFFVRRFQTTTSVPPSFSSFLNSTTDQDCTMDTAPPSSSSRRSSLQMNATADIGVPTSFPEDMYPMISADLAPPPPLEGHQAPVNPVHTEMLEPGTQSNTTSVSTVSTPLSTPRVPFHRPTTKDRSKFRSLY